MIQYHSTNSAHSNTLIMQLKKEGNDKSYHFSTFYTFVRYEGETLMHEGEILSQVEYLIFLV